MNNSYGQMGQQTMQGGGPARGGVLKKGMAGRMNGPPDFNKMQ